MKAIRLISIVFSAACLLTVASCGKEPAEEPDVPTPSDKKEIAFGAATSFENSQSTKTDYSGELVEERTYERINWVPDEDRIRILCKNALGGPQADFIVTSATNSKGAKDSYAQVKPAGSKLYWGEGEHSFFSLYPAPGMNSAIGGEVSESQCGIELDADGSSAKVSGKILPSQSGSWDGRIFKPNMNYAYMAAAFKATQGQKVQLSFKPLVTTLEFNLLASGEDVAASTLVSLELKSSSTKLTGSFTTTLNSDNTHTAPVLSDTGDKVVIDLGAGIKLSQDKSKPTRITVLSLPVDQTDLVASLNFRRDDGTTFSRSLALRKDGEAITVHACKKVYIWNLGVPDEVVTYEFEVVADLENFPAIGGGSKRKYYTITSYKVVPGKEKEPVLWDATFETEDGSKPAWLNRFTTNNASYLVSDPMTMAATVYINSDLKSQSGWPGIGSNNSEDSAQDLSLKDGVYEGASRRTANCYVVSAPGWYKLPAVYGNSLDETKGGNGDNTKAYHYVDGTGQISDELDGESFTPFVNSLGRPISQPWIVPDVGASSPDAVLCWQDVEGLVGDCSYKEENGEGYVYFFVDPEVIAYGNAIVALRNSDGTILWSWHIWTSFDKHIGTTTLTASPLPSTVVSSNELMNVPVGWVEPEAFYAPEREVWVTATQAESGKTARFRISQRDTTTHTYGNHPYYQWGRKDPMLPATGEFDKNKDKTHYGDYKWRIDNASTSVETAIQNPNVFYGGTVNGSWFIQANYSNVHHSFWDSGMGKGHIVDKKVIKTVYDSCPVGYCVPNRNAFTAFSKSEAADQKVTGLEYFNSPESGRFITGDYYRYYQFFSSPNGGGSVVSLPALGYREFGNLKNVSLKAYAWTASTAHDPDHDGSRLYVAEDAKQVHPLSDWYIKYGFAIYAVQE